MCSHYAILLDFLRFFGGHLEEETRVSGFERVPDIAAFDLPIGNQTRVTVAWEAWLGL